MFVVFCLSGKQSCIIIMVDSAQLAQKVIYEILSDYDKKIMSIRQMLNKYLSTSYISA